MKRLILLLSTVPSASLAHPGDHTSLSGIGLLKHVTTEPDHIAILLVGLGVGYIVWRRLSARK